jgi:hypothetical protein
MQGWAATVVDRTLVMLAERPLTPAEVAELDRMFTKAVRAEGPIGYLNVSETRQAPPAETRRAVMQRLLRHIESGACLGAALVVTREGFAGATLRAAFTAVLAASRPAAPVKLFGRVDEAAAWLPSILQATPGAVPTPATLMATVASLRAAATRGPIVGGQRP